MLKQRIGTECSPDGRVQDILAYKGINTGGIPVGRIELDQWLRQVLIFPERIINHLPDTLIPDDIEAFQVFLVITYNLLMDFKGLHLMKGVL